MPKAPRFIRPYEMVEIPFRTMRGVRLLRPTEPLTEHVLGVLGRSVSMFQVWVHGFNFLSNHGHLLFTVKNAQHYAGFVGHFLRNSARAVQAVTGWEGPVWAASPRPIAVLDDVSSIRRLKYVLSNGVKEGLVASPLDWPGPTGVRSMLTGEAIVTRWPMARDARRGSSESRDASTLALTPLPCWRHLSGEQQRQQVRALVDEIVAEGARDRDGRPCLGVRALLAQDPFEPTKLERAHAPIAYAATMSTLNEYLQERAAFLAGFHACSPKLRDAPVPVPFPAGAFPPAHRFTDDACNRPRDEP